MTTTLSPREFVGRWRYSTRTERAASQSHFLDLCRLVGHPSPVEADPTGEWFTFEAGANKALGGEGFADVWKKGFFALEYKGPHGDLNRAYGQLLNYAHSLENPPLLLVSDMQVIEVHTNFTNTAKGDFTLTLDDLLTAEGMDRLRAVFYDPERLRPTRTTLQVTEEAAARFAELAALLRRDGQAPEAIAPFLIRLLFCLFAEDIALLPDRLFTTMVRQSVHAPARFCQQLAGLFSAMQTGGYFGPLLIPHVDGHLFEDATVLPLDVDGMRVLSAVCELDWASIEPSVLGTLFERSLDPDKRSQLGAHYTSRDDITLIVEPVLMTPLRRRWEEVRAQAGDIAKKRDKATGRARANRQSELDALLAGFARELGAVRVLDPACGSGNFLYVALRLLLDLWQEVSEETFRLGAARLLPLQGDAPYPAQLHGIEINPYAHALAQTTIWIGYLQWLREHGYGFPGEPVLRPLDAIVQMDAILAYDADGHPTDPEWPAADIIVGNPPFLGSRKMRPELGDEYCDALMALYKGRVQGLPDLCCYWFERARSEIESGTTRRAGLLATQAIRGRSNRQVLESIKATGDIFWAWADRDWVLDGASVHVSMIAFDDGSESTRRLDGERVDSINTNLTAGHDLTEAVKLPENAGLSFQGIVPRGRFTVTPDEYLDLISRAGNPNGRPNSDVLRPWRNGRDITSRAEGSWIIDFEGLSLEEASLFEAPFQLIRERVYPARQAANQPSAREFWWRHWNGRPEMRSRLAALTRYMVVPRVAKHLLFDWLPPSVLPDCALVAIARDDDYFFGVLHSRLHELWARRQGTQLREAKSGSRYTPTTTFETYPFPWPPGSEPGGVKPGQEQDPRVRAIAVAARDLVAKRDAWLNPPAASAPGGSPPGASEAELKKRTLTDLYNANPTWLQLAHRALDRAVLAAYGWPEELAEPSEEHDAEILRRLLELNRERAKGR